MAIVHVVMKSSSSAPPSAAHAAYISRDGRYERRGGVVLAESGNMPEFAQADPHAFWRAADLNERANGRAYTELQFALPRELAPELRKELARKAAREFMGERFAYTMAIHNPAASDQVEQPHLHLMFSERVVDERTRALSEEQFFKRNGAKKDRETWHARTKPEQVRARWCELMNQAMEREGIETRVDPRTWADQGREDLAELREPKMLGGIGPEVVAQREQVAELREKRREVPAAGLDQAAAIRQLEIEAERQIAAIEMKLEEEIGVIDRLIAKAKETLEKLAQRAQSVFGGGPAPVFARAVRVVAPGPEPGGPPPTPPPQRESVALKEEYVDALLMEKYGGGRHRANADKMFLKQGEAVTVMDGAIMLRYNNGRGQFYVEVSRDEEQALQKRLSDLFSRNKKERQPEKSRDFDITD